MMIHVLIVLARISVTVVHLTLGNVVGVARQHFYIVAIVTKNLMGE